MAPALLAEIRVRDFHAAKAWYVQPLGEPSFAFGVPGSHANSGCATGSRGAVLRCAQAATPHPRQGGRQER